MIERVMVRRRSVKLRWRLIRLDPTTITTTFSFDSIFSSTPSSVYCLSLVAISSRQPDSKYLFSESPSHHWPSSSILSLSSWSLHSHSFQSSKNARNCLRSKTRFQNVSLEWDSLRTFLSQAPLHLANLHFLLRLLHPGHGQDESSSHLQVDQEIQSWQLMESHKPKTWPNTFKTYR